MIWSISGSNHSSNAGRRVFPIRTHTTAGALSLSNTIVEKFLVLGYKRCVVFDGGRVLKSV
jgi:hypothetical protein